ncbi:hypothetical protein KSP39_PZI003738 [Platanthera zijinensis]|uniref:Uncharacterized protein n=1 Tax=Platanthera zijinensis TaxID=2320716 RepID=A0AAP0GBW4_9ASPA
MPKKKMAMMNFIWILSQLYPPSISHASKKNEGRFMLSLLKFQHLVILSYHRYIVVYATTSVVYNFVEVYGHERAGLDQEVMVPARLLEDFRPSRRYPTSSPQDRQEGKSRRREDSWLKAPIEASDFLLPDPGRDFFLPFSYFPIRHCRPAVSLAGYPEVVLPSSQTGKNTIYFDFFLLIYRALLEQACGLFPYNLLFLLPPYFFSTL